MMTSHAQEEQTSSQAARVQHQDFLLKTELSKPRAHYSVCLLVFLVEHDRLQLHGQSLGADQAIAHEPIAVGLV